MSDNDRISAAELRAMGLPIPENIPDCATTRRSGVIYSTPRVTGPIADDGSLVLDMEVTISEPFSWVSAKVTVTPKFH